MPKRVIGFPLALRNNEVHPAMEGLGNLTPERLYHIYSRVISLLLGFGKTIPFFCVLKWIVFFLQIDFKFIIGWAMMIPAQKTSCRSLIII